MTAIVLSGAFSIALVTPLTTHVSRVNTNEAVAVANSPEGFRLPVPETQKSRQKIPLKDRSQNPRLEENVRTPQVQGLIAQSLSTREQQRRIALVIGNSQYPDSPLPNPVNDATDLAAALEKLEFQVTLLKDQNQQQMEQAIDEFVKNLRQGGVGLFYYAGHGAQVQGENYLIPVGANINREQDLRYKAVAVGLLLGGMEDAGNQINLVILDACRDNPFRGWRSSSRGLAPIQSAKGTLIAFATAPGQAASDGDERNSPYTTALLQYLNQPDLSVLDLFTQVTATVLEMTGNQQIPWLSSSLTSSFYLNPSTTQTATTTPPPQQPSPQPTPSPSIPQSQPGTILISKATGVDYTRLRDLLAEGKWQEADIETTMLMLQAAGREKEGWLTEQDIDKFSCEDLRIVDQLWLHSSKGKFGFSVQKEIYESLGGTRDNGEQVWEEFGDRVGWGREGLWFRNLEDDITYDVTAPKAHLPSIVRWGWGDGLEGFGVLFSRANTCNLSPTPQQPSPQPSPSPSPTAAVPRPKPAPSPSLSQPGTTLISKATGVDYTRLRDLLAEGKWKEADEETTTAMLQAANRVEEGWLRTEDVDNFSCEDLGTINQLWLDYSKGKFGFSVQKEIYENLGGLEDNEEVWGGEVWSKFAERVGWRKGDEWLSYSDLTFEIEAPKAHLPACRVFPIRYYDSIYMEFSIETVISSLAQRLVTCKIYSDLAPHQTKIKTKFM
jgi:uncharacterized caspase-like protein